MQSLISYFLNELLAPILTGILGVAATAFANYRLEKGRIDSAGKQKYKEKLGEQKAIERTSLYEGLLQCLFLLQADPAIYTDSSFLAKTALINTKLAIYSSKEIATYFNELLNKIRDRRTSYEAACNESENAHFHLVFHQANDPEDESYEQREPKSEQHLRFYLQDCECALNDYSPSPSLISDAIDRITSLIRNDLQNSVIEDENDD